MCKLSLTSPTSTLVRRMHLVRQHLLGLLRHRLLQTFGHCAVASGMALGSIAGVMDGVGNCPFDTGGELLLKGLGDDAGAYGVGSVGSFRHGELI